MSTPPHRQAASRFAQPTPRVLRPRRLEPLSARHHAAGVVTPALADVFEIRPIRPADAQLMVAALAYTSSETYYRRFHAAKRGFHPTELAYLTDVDGTTHVALVAVERGDQPRLAAEARFATNPANPSEGELGICVHDPFRRLGLGAALLRRLSAEASRCGVSQLRAIVQTDNAAMRALLYHVFPDTRVEDRCQGEVDYIAPVAPDRHATRRQQRTRPRSQQPLFPVTSASAA